MLKHCLNRWDDFYHVGWKVPSFLDSINHQNPADIDNGPFQHANNMPNKSLYTYFGENAGMGARFGGMIQMYNAGKPFFWENGWYPIKERLIEGGPKSEEEVLLVDIGGGDAGDLGILRKALGPEVKGRLILQELKHIVDRADQNGYEAQVGDWNQEQPVKGSSLNPLYYQPNLITPQVHERTCSSTFSTTSVATMHATASSKTSCQP
jgi:hypothetical protein